MAADALLFDARCALLGRLSVLAPQVATRLLPVPDSGWRDAAWAAHLEAAQAHAARRGMSVAAYLAAVNSWLATRVRVSEVRLRMRSPHLAAFLRDGRYLTQFEAPHSGGAYGHARRMIVEHTVFGVPPGCQATHRPVYGYLSGSDETGLLGQYGDVVLRLRSSARNRSTFVVGDSLDYAIAQPIGPVFVPQPVRRPTSIALIAPTDPLGLADLADASPVPYRYAEAQIYGGVGIADLAAVIFTLGTGPDQPTQNLLQSRAIDWQIV